MKPRQIRVSECFKIAFGSARLECPSTCYSSYINYKEGLFSLSSDIKWKHLFFKEYIYIYILYICSVVLINIYHAYESKWALFNC